MDRSYIKSISNYENPYEADMMGIKTIFVILLACALLSDVQGWLWWRRKSSSCGNHKRYGKPYYFGTTKLFCMKKGKGKRAPSRFTWSLSHRWIYYDGLYYEFGIGKSRDSWVSSYPVMGRRCRARRERRPAGYGVISRDCLRKCALRYKSKYGRYTLLGNNCHKFANRMSHILCHYNRCPSWCV